MKSSSLITRRHVRPGWLAVTVMGICLAHFSSLGADPVSASEKSAPLPTNSIIKSTVIEQGPVAWEEVLRQPESFVGMALTLNCQRVRLVEYATTVQTGGVARLPGVGSVGCFHYGLSADGGDACALVSANRLVLPSGEIDVSLTGVWTRFETNWNLGKEREVFGLRLTKVVSSQAETMECTVNYPLHPGFESSASDLIERTEKLIDVLTQYQPSTARQRYAKLFPPPTDIRLPFPAEIQKRIDGGFVPNESPDGDLLNNILRLHDALDLNARQLRDQQKDRDFAAQRTRTIEDVIETLQTLCEGRYPGRIEAERMRFWFASRLIVLGDLLDAQSAMGNCSVALTLDPAYAATCALLRHLGERLPNFEIIKEDDSKVSNQSLRGKWVVLYFKASERPSSWRHFFRDFVQLLESIETNGEINMTHVVVPLNKNRGAKWLDALRIRAEPQILILSPGGHLCYFNSPTNPQIPQADVFRSWILGRPGGLSRAGRILEKLGVDAAVAE